MSTTIDKVQLSLNYTGKTKRPNYGDLDGTIDYINRYTLQGGNPYLKPEKNTLCRTYRGLGTILRTTVVYL